MNQLLLGLFVLTSFAQSAVATPPPPPPEERRIHFKGGGMDGIACFQDRAVADSVRKSGEVSTGQMQYLNWVGVREIYEIEHAGSAATIVPLGKAKTGFEYTQKIADRFEKYVPAVTTALSRSMRQVDPADDFALRISSVDAYETAGTQPSDPTCAVVTLSNIEFWGRGYGEKDQLTINIDGRLYMHASHSDLSKAAFYLRSLLILKGVYSGHDDTYRAGRLLYYLIAQDPKLTLSEWLTQVVRLDFGFLYDDGQPAYTFAYAPAKVMEIYNLVDDEVSNLYDNYPARADKKKVIDEVQAFFKSIRGQSIYEEKNFLGYWSAKDVSEITFEEAQDGEGEYYSGLCRYHRSPKKCGKVLKVLESKEFTAWEYSDERKRYVFNLTDGDLAKIQDFRQQLTNLIPGEDAYEGQRRLDIAARLAAEFDATYWPAIQHIFGLMASDQNEIRVRFVKFFKDLQDDLGSRVEVFKVYHFDYPIP